MGVADLIAGLREAPQQPVRLRGSACKLIVSALPESQ
jgi:hypothetical protein